MDGRTPSRPEVVTLDLELLGTPRSLAAHLVRAARPGDGHALVDCGPGSTLPRLRAAVEAAGARLEDVRTLLLTHVHLDHAGAAGALARELGLDVLVHTRGAAHLLDPSRLVASALRVFGARTHELWGEMLAVPPERLRALEGGETVRAAGLEFRAIYTPGHAVHHLAFALDREVFAGDAAGVRLPDDGLVVPPTPPPDVDLDAWAASIHALRALGPRRLYLSHFGPVDDAGAHLDRLETALDAAGRAALEGVRAGEDREAIARRLRAAVGVPDVPPGGPRAYRPGSLSPVDAAGLERYWRRALPAELGSRSP